MLQGFSWGLMGALGLWGFGKAQGRASGLGRRNRAGGEERREEGLQGPSPRSNGSKAASIERDLAELSSKKGAREACYSCYRAS